jgi:hypothetical protein
VISCASNLPNVAHIRSQEEVPGPIWVASLANDGFMAHHLRAQEQHVAPGDVILALDGKAVVSTPAKDERGAARRRRKMSAEIVCSVLKDGL